MIKTLQSRCRGHGFDPGSGKIPHTVWHSQKKECIFKKNFTYFWLCWVFVAAQTFL